MTKYTFKTIVAPEAVRADFTALRDELNSSDKELMQAIWNIGTKSRGELQVELDEIKMQNTQVRVEKKEMKAAAKLREKEVVVKEEKAPKAKKAAKKAAKAPKIDDSGFEVAYSAADEEGSEMNS